MTSFTVKFDKVRRLRPAGRMELAFSRRRYEVLNLSCILELLIQAMSHAFMILRYAAYILLLAMAFQSCKKDGGGGGSNDEAITKMVTVLNLHSGACCKVQGGTGNRRFAGCIAWHGQVDYCPAGGIQSLHYWRKHCGYTAQKRVKDVYDCSGQRC